MKAQKVLTTKILICVLASIMLSLTLIPFLYKLTTKQTKPTYAAEDLHISDPAGLNNFKQRMENGETFAGSTVYLDNDIDYGGGEWTHDFSKEGTFSGVFDGCGYKISRIKANQYDLTTVFGIFRKLKDASIKNLWIDNINFECSSKSNTYIALLAAYAEGDCTLESVNITNSSIRYTELGSNSGTIRPLGIGSFIGFCSGTLNVNNCSAQLNEIYVNFTGKTGFLAEIGKLHVGGLIGFVNSGTIKINQSYAYVESVKMLQEGDEDCKKKAEYTIDAHFGGLVGGAVIGCNGYIINSFSCIKSYKFGFTGSDRIQLGCVFGASISYNVETYSSRDETNITIANCAYNQKLETVNSLKQGTAFSKIDQSIIDKIVPDDEKIWQSTDMTSLDLAKRKAFYKKLGWIVGDLYG